MTPPAHVLLFRVGDRRLAVDLDEVGEVLRAVWVTPLPDARGDLVGTINLRGTAVPVHDLRVRLGGLGGPFPSATRFVTWRSQVSPVVFVVDEVFGVVGIEAGEWRAREVLGEADVSPIVRGALTRDDGVTPVIGFASLAAETAPPGNGSPLDSVSRPCAKPPSIAGGEASAGGERQLATASGGRDSSSSISAAGSGGDVLAPRPGDVAQRVRGPRGREQQPSLARACFDDASGPGA